ncbi:hypothetical protein C6Y40_03755 [Alteromonas alba]|uniref:Uncharacterized protein n=1 Tax=Alteromonas alba TaxID=2079529 RepID=A0A2S9VEN6_9ALTE|nr:hypothetical protein [Alteromonas alba]PRO74920.1 hypothetical protein C6Y40_03755 [Alteromonas alba]
MISTRSLILTPVPTDIGLQAAQRPDVLYFLKQQALVVPVSVLRAAQQSPEPTTPSDADWALYAVCHEYLGTPISTIPLHVKAAIVKEVHAPQPIALQPVVAQCLDALKRCLVMVAQRVYPKPGTQVLSADSKTTLMLGESGTRVTGKTITNFYR